MVQMRRSPRYCAWIRRGAAEAQAAGFHAEEITLDLYSDEVQRVEKVDPRSVAALVKRLRHAGDWPEDLPLVV